MATGALLSTSRVAFAFDIDGTLTRGSIAIPEASSPLLYLQQNNIPFILLTNAGGATEAAKASALSQILNVPLSPDQVVQGHTPFSALVDGPEQLRHKPVLVIGDDPTGDGPRVLARSYGFEQVITPNDILAAFPTLLSHPHSYALNNVQALPKDSKIAAIFIFTKPADWAPVLQIIMDLLLSCGGQLGTLSPKNGDMELLNSGYLQDGQPKIHISNSDMTFMADYPLPLFGTGSFRVGVFIFCQLLAKSIFTRNYDTNFFRRLSKEHGMDLRTKTSSSTSSSTENQRRLALLSQKKL